MKKSCRNCAHAKKRTNQLPCRRCFKAEHWEPMTNAQRIRSMTDEELAEFLAPSFTCYACPSRALCDKSEGKDCNQVFLWWLKQPYEEGLHGTE